MSAVVGDNNGASYAPMAMEVEGYSGDDGYTAMQEMPVASSAGSRRLRCNVASERTEPLETGNAHLPGALLLGTLILEEGGELGLESGSTYGAALLLPQVARSAEWPRFLTFLAIRSFIFLLLGISVQLYLLHLLSREESVMNVFAGQMHLCNFAQGVRGPAGSISTPPRTYDFSQWALRSFARDSVKAVFPKMADEIDSAMDAGEYALESWEARWACCFVFMMATFQELVSVLRTAWLLYAIPTAHELWIGRDFSCKEGSWLEQVSVKIAGMPARWKILYSVFVVLPKFVIWKLCCQTGISYLMDTSTIEGIIVNSVALAFILNIDENLCATLMSEPVRVLMSKCEAYQLYDESQTEKMGHREILDRFHARQSLKNITASELLRWLPGKLFASVLVTMAFICDYYSRNCTFTHDGVLVSKPLFLPKSTGQSFLSLILPNFFGIEAESEPFWTMPED